MSVRGAVRRNVREAGGGPIVDELDVVVTDMERLAGRTETA